MEDNPGKLVDMAAKAIDKVTEPINTLLVPFTKNLGIALGDLSEYFFVSYKLKIANEKRRFLYEQNLKRVSDKINEIPPEKVIPVQLEIGVPALEKLSYTSSEEIADMFANLLCAAANEETVNQAHPGFVDILGRISTDEAKIVSSLTGEGFIPVINVLANAKRKGENGLARIEKSLTLLGRENNLAFPKNVPIYLDNLLSLGILVYVENNILDKNMYDKIEAEYTKLFKKLELGRELAGIDNFVLQRHHFRVSYFGKLFINTAMGLERLKLFVY